MDSAHRSAAPTSWTETKRVGLAWLQYETIVFGLMFLGVIASASLDALHHRASRTATP